jgi:hypothetical protein
MPVLADIFSAGNTLKRRMKDFVADPGAFLETEVNYRNQKAGEFNTLQDLATQGDINKMRGLPVTQEQQAAELRLRDIVAGAYNPMGLTVYHGSPYLFPRFDPRKIGTGEGAQAYGVGSGYTAEARPIAERYREEVKDLASVGNINEKLSELNKIMEADSVYPGAYQKFKSDVGKKASEEYDALMGQRSDIYKAPGYLYKGDIPDEILPKFLDWDKPLSQQSEDVRNALKRRIVDVVPQDKFDMGGNARLRDNRYGKVDPTSTSPWLMEATDASGTKFFGLTQKDVDRMFGSKDAKDLTGEQIYARLTQDQGSQQAASAYLDGIGLRGIRYLDQVSRGEGKGTSNFVPFRPEDFKIQEINDEPLEAWLKSGRLKVDESDPLMQFLGQK